MLTGRNCMGECEISYLPSGYFKHIKEINNIPFTAREIDIISSIIHARGSSKIASILDISPRTVETYIIKIKRKIDNSTREGIIDFVERSGKYDFIRKHYQSLLITADFNKKLKSLTNIISNNNLLCYFFCCSSTIKEPIIAAIKNHIESAGVKIKICSIHEKIFNNKQENHFIYVISPKINNQHLMQALQEYKSNPILFTFLVTKKLDHNLARELEGIPYINFFECKNYYVTIIEVLKRLYPKVNFNSLATNLKEYHTSITEHQGLIIKDSAHGLKQKTTNATNLFTKIDTKNKWLILALSIPIFILGFNIVVIKQLTQKVANMELINSNTNNQHTMTSYIPEILTGYEHFIGRNKELKEIKQQLVNGNIVIISGAAGVGKSTCAIEFAKHYKKHHKVRYFNAEFTAKMDQQYKELAEELALSVEQQPKNVIMQLVNNKLSSLNTKILFILDNVDLYDDAKEYLINLPCNVQAIITTRQPLLIANVHHIVLEEFNEEEAEAYLKQSLQNRHLTNNFIHQLVQNNSTLPYDLKCMTAYLLDNPSADNHMIANVMGSKIKNKLFEEFIISHDQLRQQAWKILQYSSFLDPDFIDLEIIKKLFPTTVELSSIALKKLESLSLIIILNNQNDQTGFKVHRKLQQNVQNSMNNYPTHAIGAQKIIRHLFSAMDQLFPEANHSHMIPWKQAHNIYSHVIKVLKTASKTLESKDQTYFANLCYKVAKYHLRVNINYHLALEYAQLSLKERYKTYRTNHPDLANALNLIGIVYRRLGNLQEGLQYSKQALKMRQKIYSSDHGDIQDSLKHVSTAYLQNGETRQGLKYSQMALEMSQRLYPPNHYEVARSLNTVGMCYLDLGDFEKSLGYLKASLDIFNMQNPINYERVAALQSNLSYNYNKLGNYTEALRYAQSSVDIFKKLYPEGHPRAIYSLGDLGYTLLIGNDIQNGLKILHQALAMSKIFNMEKHYVTAHVFHDLGWGYFKNKDYRSALKYSTEALDLRKELYHKAKNHPELAESLSVLGDINAVLKNKAIALKLYQEALNMYSVLSLQHLPEYNEIKQKITQLNALEGVA